MKLCIVTIQSVNFGNRLQNYALQTILERKGYEARSVRRRVVSPVNQVKNQIRRLVKDDALEAFRRFDRKYIHFAKEILSPERVTSSFASAFDYYIIGSDQVWNPNFTFNSELDYLPMIPSRRKIAYAASFGVSNLNSNFSRTAELLNDIPYISMREDAGSTIVEGLINRKVPVVLDPTMLLAPEDWKIVASAPSHIDLDGPYAFKYVLGDDVNAPAIARLAREYDMQTVDVRDPTLKIGPSEFVWLLAHSSLVCTDSFHASVFALLHHKPLAIFEREDKEVDMSSRFDTLCQSFGLVGHRSLENGFSAQTIFGTNWRAVDSKLESLRTFSSGWLESAIVGCAGMD